MLLLGFSGKKTVFNNVPLLDYKYDFGFGLFSEESLFSAMMKTVSVAVCLGWALFLCPYACVP